MIRRSDQTTIDAGDFSISVDIKSNIPVIIASTIFRNDKAGPTFPTKNKCKAMPGHSINGFRNKVGGIINFIVINI